MNYLSLLICKLIGKHAETGLRRGEPWPHPIPTDTDSRLIRICRRCNRVRLATARKAKA